MIHLDACSSLKTTALETLRADHCSAESKPALENRSKSKEAGLSVTPLSEGRNCLI